MSVITSLSDDVGAAVRRLADRLSVHASEPADEGGWSRMVVSDEGLATVRRLADRLSAHASAVRLEGSHAVEGDDVFIGEFVA